MHVEDRCIRILKSKVGNRKWEVRSGKSLLGFRSFCAIPFKIFLYFLQGDADNGRELIVMGIKMREELGVPLYTAAGNCDLGSE